MNRKIKLIISLIVFTLFFTIAQQSFAFKAINEAHTDMYTGIQELVPQKEGDPNFYSKTSAAGGTFCITRGWPLRFTPDKIETTTINGCEVHFNANCEHYYPGNQTEITTTKDGVGQFLYNSLKPSTHTVAGAVKDKTSAFYQYNGNDNGKTWTNKSSEDKIKELLSNAVSGATYVGYGNDFTKEQQYTLAESNKSYKNDYVSYLLSAGSWNGAKPTDYGFEQGNYPGTKSDSANAQLIQDAIWTDNPGLNQGNDYTKKTADSIALLNEAKTYQTYVDNGLLNKGKASFDTNIQPQVIVNQTNRTYTIGPYKLNYPSDTRFYYVQTIYVLNGNKSVKPTVITSSGKYPNSGELFFLQFNADALGNPTSVQIQVKFAYLSETTAQYDKYTGSGEIWTYVAYYTQRDDMKHNIKNSAGKWVECTYTEVNGYAKPFKIGNYESQILIQVKTIGRTWSEDSITTPNSIDLRMSLGGYVWEDSNGGKESLANGLLDNNEKRVPHVIVDLYKQDGTHMGTQTTDKNGQYRFDNLNAMDRYYVTFTYNGQYYEPTTYASSSTWGSPQWSTNSNATDVASERRAYNTKFEHIGSSPANYVVNGVNRETFSKNELLGLTLGADGQYKKTRDAVIDEFGNLILQNSSNALTQKMIQFVKDCQITASTGNGTGAHDLYPVNPEFVINNAILASKSPELGPYYPLYFNSNNISCINLGLHPRQEADLAIKKDIEKVSLEINGQKQEYTYNTLENKPGADGTWDISVRLSDSYYNTNYSREIYKSDYLYKVTNYGTNFADYGKTKNDELEVYVTYKIMVLNQSLSIQMRVNELVDYYDSDYEYIDSRSYIQIGRNGSKSSVRTQNNSRYGSTTEINLNGYNKMYIEGLDGTYLNGGQIAYVYLTFRVKKDVRDNEAWLKLDEDFQNGNAIGVGKENIVEINGYYTRYASGTRIPNAGDVGNTPAGIIDVDSKPGNLEPNDVPKDKTINYQNFEDDTDKAPNLRLKLYREDSANRVISGVVWEDERTKTIGATTTGDGIKQDNEKRINGVTVQLVEIMDNGREFVWRTFENGSGTASSTKPIIDYNGLVQNYNFGENHDGAYAFKSFIPGKYIVRFIYGDTEKTVLTKDANDVNKTLGRTGLNEKSYNGQDYKSTTYQAGITQNKNYTWRNNSTWNLGQETLGGVLKEIPTFKADASNNETGTYLYDTTESDKKSNVSDAKDIKSIRDKVVNYSKGDITNRQAEVLASFRDLPTYAGKAYTKAQMESLIKELIDNTKMTAETGVMVMEIEYNREQTGGQEVNNKTTYALNNLDLGLEERPKAQIAIDKKVTRVKLTLADGTILFDTTGPTTNVLWKEHKPYSNNQTLMDPAVFGTLANIRKQNAERVGLVQISMDEELMHGATIQISYAIRAGNIGEVDYQENSFYYTGQVKDVNTVVKTKAIQVVDYVANNLQFNANDNANLDWSLTNKDALISSGLINKGLESAVENYNTILITDKLNEYLVPTVYKDKVNKNAKDTTDSISLVLTQVITPENTTDDLSYRNIVEIVKTNNTAGRRNEFSVVGNQDPTKEPQEIDTDRAEVVKILPPFGNAGIYMIIAFVVIVAAGIIVGGIIFIKKKVLKQ